jgi:hypothetical protein
VRQTFAVATALAAALSIAGCSGGQPPLPPDPYPGDVRAVYAFLALVPGLRNVTRRVVYDSLTITVAYLDSVLEESGETTWRDQVPHAYRAAFSNLEQAAGSPRPTPFPLGSAYPEARVGSDSVLLVFPSDSSCGAYGRRFPGATGYFRFSPVGWSHDSSRAIVAMDKRCWWGPAHSASLILLRAESDGRMHWDSTVVLWYKNRP